MGMPSSPHLSPCFSELHLFTPKLFASPDRSPFSPAVAVLHSSTARGIATGPKLAGAQVGGHTLALGIPQQSQGAITAGHTAVQLPTVFRLPAVVTTCWGTLLVLLATGTQDSWAQRHMQVRGCSAPLPPKESKASNLRRSEILLGPFPAAKPLDPPELQGL